MGGSRKWFKYTDDAGTEWAMNRDESNIENIVVSDSNVDYSTSTFIKYSVPSNLQVRYGIWSSDTTVRKLKITIPTRGIYDDLASNLGLTGVRSFLFDGETFTLTFLKGETIKPIPFEQDTGLNDGDNT